MTLARQMYPGNPNHLMDHFHEATSKPYGYLLIDLKPYTPEHLRMRSTAFELEGVNRDSSTVTTEENTRRPIQEQQNRDTMTACDDCGLVFANDHNLQKHANSWCHGKRKGKIWEDDVQGGVPLVKKRCMSFDDRYDDDDDSDEVDNDKNAKSE